jgi:hypothetical protein
MVEGYCTRDCIHANSGAYNRAEKPRARSRKETGSPLDLEKTFHAACRQADSSTSSRARSLNVVSLSYS